MIFLKVLQVFLVAALVALGIGVLKEMPPPGTTYSWVKANCAGVP